MPEKELTKNLNFPVPLREYQRLRNMKEKSGAKNWFEFLCAEKLDLTNRDRNK